MELFRRKKAGNADLDYLLGAGQQQVKNIKAKKNKTKIEKKVQEIIPITLHKSMVESMIYIEERRESVLKIKDEDDKLNFINFVVPV